MSTEEEKKESGYLLTTRQAAAYMGVGENVIRDLSRRAHDPLPYINIPGTAFPRYTRQILTDYFNSFVTTGEQSSATRGDAQWQ